MSLIRPHFESSVLRYYLAGNLATMNINAGHLKAAACKILFLSNKIPNHSCASLKIMPKLTTLNHNHLKMVEWIKNYCIEVPSKYHEYLPSGSKV
jgi:hypothetical protein